MASKPSSIAGAYRILKGRQSGDWVEAKGFLNTMSYGERIARGRSESQGKVKVRKRKRPMGTGPYPYNSRQYR